MTFDGLVNGMAARLGVDKKQVYTELQAAWVEIGRTVLEDAANDIDFQFEVFKADDGILSIREHGKSPAKLLTEYAYGLSAPGVWPESEFACPWDGEVLESRSGVSGSTGWIHLHCTHCERKFTREGRPFLSAPPGNYHHKKAIRRDDNS